MPVRFSEVKTILDNAVAAWSAERNGEMPDFRHHNASFGWSTRDELLNLTAYGYQLIEPHKIGNNQGDQTNLVVALSNPDGVDGFGRMPNGGPYLSQEKIDVIIAWINDGALGDDEQPSGVT
jgi:hypothetical protein